MSKDLFRLVYLSRNRLPGPPEDVGAAIRAILAVSQARNRAAGVTGALLFNAGWFGQLLEGPGDAVEATFERIQQDERHDDIAMLGFDRVEARAFPTWSMGFVGATPEDAARFADIGRRSGFDPARLSGEALREALLQHLLRDEPVPG